jgi:sugar O-acyltransferase (sialic acid O-acetyltransferase NeuD family)
LRVEKKLIVFGAGGHGKVVAAMAAEAGFLLAGFADDAAALHGSTVFGLLVLGGLEWLYDMPPETYTVALAVGDNYARRAVAQSLIYRDIEVATICSPSAMIAHSARIGRGAVVMPSVAINPDASVGEGAILNTGAIVEHDVTIGHYAHVSPNATIGGGAAVGDLTHIAISATVLPLVRIGSRSVLGAGSVAVRDIPEDVVAFGSPARIQRWARAGMSNTHRRIPLKGSRT